MFKCRTTGFLISISKEMVIICMYMYVYMYIWFPELCSTALFSRTPVPTYPKWDRS